MRKKGGIADNMGVMPRHVQRPRRKGKNVSEEAGTGPAPPGARGRGARVGLVLGLVLFAALLAAPAPEGMAPAAWRAAAVAALMAVWWISEALPLAATALLPLALFPLLGVVPIADAAAPYANPLIFLFLGGFMIAAALERWELHRRLALHIVRRVGTRRDALVAGFMAATAFLSMWLSNTATAVMMLPIALSVIRLLDGGGPAPGGGDGSEARRFAVALLLGVAYAANIGGMGTLVGTPPNALFAAFMDQTYGIEIGFARWMLVAVPLALVMLVLAWAVLAKLVYPLATTPSAGVAALIADQVRRLGPPSRGERLVGAVFAAVALMWVCRPLVERALPGLGLTDPGIAVFGALLLFVLPVAPRRGVFVMNWETAQRLPWGVLVLLGGGLSLGAAIQSSGLSAWIGEAMGGLAGWPLIAGVGAVTLILMAVSHVTSNTATTAAFLPLVAALAGTLGENPLTLLVPATLAASLVFSLPVATPPNAIIFGSGMITAGQMARAGIVLNLAALVLVPLVVLGLVALVFAAEPGVVPAWAGG